jgi:hypothetical protein
MRYSMLTCVALAVLLTACGSDQKAAAPAAPSAAVPAPTGAPAPAPEAAAPAAMAEGGSALPAASDSEEVVYDPIDVSRLDNTWWGQYNQGG